MEKKQRGQFGVKAEPKELAQPAVLTQLRKIYSKYKILIWVSALVLILASAYFRGFLSTITNVMEIILALVFIGNIWPLVKYIKNAKDEHQRERRIAVLGAIVVALIGVALLVTFWFKDTNIGLTLQRFLYHTNDIKLQDVNGITPIRTPIP